MAFVTMRVLQLPPEHIDPHAEVLGQHVEPEGEDEDGLITLYEVHNGEVGCQDSKKAQILTIITEFLIGYRKLRTPCLPYS